MSESIRVAIVAEGLFRLSDEAILRCVEKGMTLAPPLLPGARQFAPGYDFFTWSEDHTTLFTDQKYGAHRDSNNEFRTNAIVLSMIEEMGDEAMAFDSYDRDSRVGQVKIIEIPFPSTEGWHIRWFECGTGEYIVENHRTWQ